MRGVLSFLLPTPWQALTLGRRCNFSGGKMKRNLTLRLWAATGRGVCKKKKEEKNARLTLSCESTCLLRDESLQRRRRRNEKKKRVNRGQHILCVVLRVSPIRLLNRLRRDLDSDTCVIHDSLHVRVVKTSRRLKKGKQFEGARASSRYLSPVIAS